MVFAPERVTQGESIRQLRELPQIIGADDQTSHDLAASFFDTFAPVVAQRLLPIEAEIGKLVTNTARYVSFALANEYHMIAQSYSVNINKIIDAINSGYPRLSLPSPGPNVGGPCLYKDGWFLIERIPFNEIIASAIRINEGMPAYILSNLARREGIGRVAILGMTFKANSDDMRNSVAY